MRVHPEAAREARAARRWYSEYSKDAGERFVAAYRQAVKVIADSPARWPSYLGARRYHMRRFPYSVIFDVAADGVVEILAVTHDRRGPGYWRRRSL